MPQVPDEEHYRMIAKRLVRGAVVPFLGAAVSVCGRPESVAWQRGRDLPRSKELSAYLAHEVDYPYPDATDVLRVSQYVDVELGSGPLYELLHQVFAADYEPTALHRLLASLPDLIRRAGTRQFPLIVTTNYDDARSGPSLKRASPMSSSRTSPMAITAAGSSTRHPPAT